MTNMETVATTTAMPTNCTEVNGYWVCSNSDTGKFDMFDPAQKCWFGFDFDSFEDAARSCNGLDGNGVSA